MATSGKKSITFAKYLTLRFNWTQASISEENNTSTVNWNLQLIADQPATISSSRSKKWNVTVNGTKYNGTNTVGINPGSTKTLASGSTVVTHNTDGTKTFSYSFSQEFGINFSGTNIGTQSASSTGTLDTIVRRARVTAAPNFNDEENPTITYINFLGNSVNKVEACISLTGSKADVPYREISKTGTSYTFNLTSEERNTLREATSTSNSRTIRFYIQTTIGASIMRHSITKTLSIINCEPVVTGTVEDTKPRSIALTGDPTRIISGYNIVTASITATPKKGATITGYQIINDGKIVSETSSVTLENVESGNFQLIASDSRGNSTTVQTSNTTVDYTYYTSRLETGVPSATGSVSLSISGNFFNGSFGKVTNTLRVWYRYRELGDANDYTELIEVEPTISGNTYSAHCIVSGLDYQKTYQFQAYIADKVWGTWKAPVTVKINPVFDWSATDFNFNVPIYYKGDTKLCYEPGDTITFTDYSACWAGFTTDAGKRARFTIPLSKPILATRATVSGTVVCRGNGSYLDGISGISIPNSNKFSYETGISETGIYVYLIYKEAIPNVQNNGAFIATPSGTFSITLS